MKYLLNKLKAKAMNKIWLITKREYITRVKNKSFILTTLLMPLGILAFSAIAAWIFSQRSDDQKKIAVVDPAGILAENMPNLKNIEFELSTKDLKSLGDAYKNNEINGVLEIPSEINLESRNFGIKYYSDDLLAIDESLSIESSIRSSVRNYKIKALGLDKEIIDNLNTDIDLKPETIKKITGEPITKDDKEINEMTSAIGAGLGAGIGYFLFFIILLYGTMVMRSVMEEKVNRISEVMISSVKPFQLMMGKIMGVGLAGLTQLGIWLIMIPLIIMVVMPFLGLSSPDMADMVNLPNEEVAAAIEQSGSDKISQVLQGLLDINWIKVIPLTLIYFFGGYFAYAALFAAVGSAVGEDINEGQSLTFPVMIPLIISIYIGFSAVTAPNSTLAVWSSIIPLLSSIVMPVRLPLDPAWWQILLSIVLMVLFIIATVWLAGRIYRVGILMYGKKASLKELGRWIFYKS
ncbi:MAG: ABC transporter permease [Bacteroidota bacterium]